MKLKKVEAYMKMARAIASLSPDPKTQVGAILISPTGRQIASGYNGFLRGAIDDELPKTSPEKHEFIQHAERNVLYNCLDEGISTRGCTMLTTLSPCTDCLRACFQAGITTMIFDEKWRKLSLEDYASLPDVSVEVDCIGKYTRLNMRCAANYRRSEA